MGESGQTTEMADIFLSEEVQSEQGVNSATKTVIM